MQTGGGAAAQGRSEDGLPLQAPGGHLQQVATIAQQYAAHQGQYRNTNTPELDKAFFRQAELHLPGKKAVTIRLDADVLEWSKNQGAGYQTRINQLLRQYMQAHRG